MIKFLPPVRYIVVYYPSTIYPTGGRKLIMGSVLTCGFMVVPSWIGIYCHVSCVRLPQASLRRLDCSLYATISEQFSWLSSSTKFAITMGVIWTRWMMTGFEVRLSQGWGRPCPQRGPQCSMVFLSYFGLPGAVCSAWRALSLSRHRVNHSELIGKLGYMYL